MTVIKFPHIGSEVDFIIKKMWSLINDLPDETSVGSIVAAMEITKFDLIERVERK